MLTQSWTILHTKEVDGRWSISIRGVENGITPALNQVTLINCSVEDLEDIITRLNSTKELIRNK